MKRTTKQMTVASLFACALAAASFGAVSFNSASAEVETSNNITMFETASLRLEETLEGGTQLGFGMRFKTQINAEWYNGLTNPQVYTLLLPTKLLDGELTADAVQSLGAVQADLDEEKKYSVDGEQTYLFNTVLTEIPTTAYGTEISVRSYITADGMAATYSPLTTEYASAARSVVQLADAALSSDADKWDSVKKYLITGIDVPDDRYLAKEKSSNVNAKLLFAEGTSETVQATLTEKYKLSYVSDNEQIVEVAEDGTLTAVSAGTANITVANEALGVSKTVKVTVYEATDPTYGVISFENLDMVDDVKAYNLAQNLKLVEDGVSFYHDGKTKELVGFSMERPQWLANFDTMTITVELTDGVALEGAKDWLFYGISGVGSYYTLSEGSGANLNLNNSKNTYVFDLATLLANKNMANVVEDAMSFYVKRRQSYLGQSATFTIGAPEFAINDISAKMGETVNLYEKFHTEEGKATFTITANGVEKTIENPAAYAGTTSGVITATISMDGYADGTVTANYNYTNLVAYGQVLDFTDKAALEAANPTAYGTGSVSDVSVVENGTDKYAIAFTATNIAKKTYGVNIMKPDWVDDIADNVYLNVTFKLYENTAKNNYYVFSTNLLGHSNTKVGNKVIADEQSAMSNTGKVSLQAVIDTKDTSKLRLFVTSITALSGTSKFMITDISFGYKDIMLSSDVENSLNLATHFAVKESEISNVTFNGETVSDVTKFKPTEGGTLSFTLNREGYLTEECSVNVVMVDSLTYSGTVINIQTVLGVNSAHFSATYQEASASSATALADGANGERVFAPTESGVLTITLDAKSPQYAACTLVLDVTVETTA